MKPVYPMDGKKRFIFSLFLLSILTIGSGNFYFSEGKYTNLKDGIWNVREGVNICFARLQQTFTSTFVSPNLAYLSKDFTKQTEECFAQALASVVDLSMDESVELEKSINRLGNFIRLFHTGMNKNSVLASDSERKLSVANARFLKLEESKDEIFELTDGLFYKVSDRLNMAKNLFGSFVVTGILFLVWMVFQAFRLFGILEKTNTLSSKNDEETESVKKRSISDQIEITKTETPKPGQPIQVKTQKKSNVQRPVEQLLVQESETLTDCIDDLLVKFSGDILKNKVALSYDRFDEVVLRGDERKLRHLLSVLFNIVSNSTFRENPYIKIEARSDALFQITTNSHLSQLQSEQSRFYFEEAKNAVSKEYELKFEKQNAEEVVIVLRQNRKLASVVRGTKKEILQEMRG
ncbi:MAG: hypothetical protein ACPGJV_15120 [Bacteriovoracaceae bacterium]